MGTNEIKIRAAREEEVERIAEIEAICFPEAEAAGLADFKERMKAFPENFLVAVDGDTIIGFINGCNTDKPVLGDELYHDATLHKPDGEIQTVFGLDVLPQYQHRGIGHQLMRAYIEHARTHGKKAVILTCKEQKITFYESLGYKKQGIADSEHGGAVWYDMQQWF